MATGTVIDAAYYVTPAWLRVDTTFAPLKGNARFDKLMAER